MEKQICEMAELICDNMVHGLCDTTGYICNHNCEYKCRAKDLYNAGYRKQEWISVEERLPEDERQVLVCGMRGRVCVCRYESRYDKNFRGIRTGFYRNEDKKFMNVRHWMPLPSAPKGDAE